MSKKPKPYRRERLGIINPYGDIWTSETFDTEQAARKYIADFWRGLQGEADIDQFKVVPVVVRVSALEPTP